MAERTVDSLTSNSDMSSRVLGNFWPGSHSPLSTRALMDAIISFLLTMIHLSHLSEGITSRNGFRKQDDTRVLLTTHNFLT